jgi:hypothetical protein
VVGLTYQPLVDFTYQPLVGFAVFLIGMRKIGIPLLVGLTYQVRGSLVGLTGQVRSSLVGLVGLTGQVGGSLVGLTYQPLVGFAIPPIRMGTVLLVGLTGQVGGSLVQALEELVERKGSLVGRGAAVLVWVGNPDGSPNIGQIFQGFLFQPGQIYAIIEAVARFAWVDPLLYVYET